MNALKSLLHFIFVVAENLNHLRAPLAFSLLVGVGTAVAHAQSAAGSVAKVSVVIGKVRLQQAGQWRAVKAGDQIAEEARLETSADGYVYIKTSDRGFISLRPNSVLSFESYRYDPASPTETVIKLTLHKGVMRSISGLGAQNARDKFRLNTPVAAIGIRGTDFSTFADDQTTLVSVRTGGIVAAPFGENCLRTGFGPCQGESTLDLLAGRPSAVLQVKQGESKPQILERGLDKSPEKIAPPLMDENNAAQLSSKASLSPITTQSDMLLVGGLADVIATPISWGRWTTVANLPASETMDAFVNRLGKQPDVIKRPYVMARETDPAFKLPTAGRFDFTLRAYEAFIVDNNTRKVSGASIQNAALSIDFDRMQFGTSLDLQAGGNSLNISGNGNIKADGRLQGSLSKSNASIDGVLAGQGADKAGYLFSKPAGTTGLSAFGATFWDR